MSSAFSRYNSDKMKRQQKVSKHEIETKKTKYDEKSSSFNTSNSNIMQYEEEQIEEEEEGEEGTGEAEEEIEESDDKMNESNSTTSPPAPAIQFIGLETFNNANTLCDLNTANETTSNVDEDGDDDLLLLTLNSNENFTFKGKIMIRLLYGCVEVNGYKLNSSKHKKIFYNLYSPESHSSMLIRNRAAEGVEVAEDREEVVNDIVKNLSEINKNLNKENLIEYLNNCLEGEESSKGCSIVLFKKMKSKLCNYFNKFDRYKQMYQASHLINYITNPNDIKFAYLGIHPVDSINSVLSYTQNEHEIFDEIVAKTLQNRQKPEIILACGGKDMGKSTYLRYLTNILLNSHEKVAYLDCDPGQCEFTLSGSVQLTVISEPLMGPPHSHIVHSTDCSYFLGHISPNDIPGCYLESIKKCLACYQKMNSDSINKIPLIINTMGWTQGLGLCLLKEQINILQPTFIIQINSSDVNKNLPTIDYEWFRSSTGWPPKQDSSTLQSLPNYKLFTINRTLASNNNSNSTCVRRKTTNYLAKDHREVAIIAYFSSLQEKHTYFRPIHHIKPYRVPWSHFALHVAHSRVAYEEIFRALNASLVGLCKIDEKYIRKPFADSQLPGYLDFSNENDQVKATLNSFKCFGFGIIRGINMDTREFYIITPEPLEKLNHVNLLVKGNRLWRLFFFQIE